MPVTITKDRFDTLISGYSRLSIALLGDFCLDRYLEIDPTRQETSIETGLPVHNVTRVRAQPGGAGTILNNLAALGVGRVFPLGFVGEDGEGFELLRALRQVPNTCLDHFIQTPLRHTFTYCKPLVITEGKPPAELNRLDTKNWSPTPEKISNQFAQSLLELAKTVDAVIVLDQVDVPETGVVTHVLRQALATLPTNFPALLVLADSRRSLANFPPAAFKMNSSELARLHGQQPPLSLDEVRHHAQALARQNGRPVFVTAAERGMIGASPTGEVVHVPAFPVRGPIDIVGAGDAVSANLASAIAAGASLLEALEVASAAASVVIHKLGTTGTACPLEIRNTIFSR